MSHSDKILICDLFPVAGHKSLNMTTIGSLRDVDVTLCTEVDYFDNSFLSEQKKVVFHPLVRTKTQLIKSLRYTLNLIKLLRREKYSKVLILTYETRSFILMRLLANKYLSRLFLIQHYNIDAIKNDSISQICFSSYRKKVNHIVYQEFIAKHMINDMGIPSDKISWVNHPGINMHDYPVSTDNLICALSVSNSVEKLNTFIEYEVKYGELNSNGYTVLLKDRIGLNHIDVSSINYISGYIPDDQFNKYLKQSKWALLLYPDEFEYRESGFLIEALSNSTLVVGYKSCKVIEAYSKRYPNVCFAVEDENKIVDIVLNYECNNLRVKEDFERFKKEHSVEQFTHSMRRIIAP